MHIFLEQFPTVRRTESLLKFNSFITVKRAQFPANIFPNKAASVSFAIP